jgi:hypothetical protein
VYLILVVLIIIQYSRKALERDSARDRAVLFEVRFFVIATAVLWVAVVLRYAIPTTPNLLVPLGASLLIYGMGYLKLRRPEPDVGKDEQPARKYEKSTLTPERSERYLGKLVNFMEKEKPFTDGDLTIQKLAEKLSIPANHLSQTINERWVRPSLTSSIPIASKPPNGNYSTRVQTFVRTRIAEEVGFNSKSSFNSVFKKHTNMTPSEFRNQNNGSGSNGVVETGFDWTQPSRLQFPSSPAIASEDACAPVPVATTPGTDLITQLQTECVQN